MNVQVDKTRKSDLNYQHSGQKDSFSLGSFIYCIMYNLLCDNYQKNKVLVHEGSFSILEDIWHSRGILLDGGYVCPWLGNTIIFSRVGKPDFSTIKHQISLVWVSPMIHQFVRIWSHIQPYDICISKCGMHVPSKTIGWFTLGNMIIKHASFLYQWSHIQSHINNSGPIFFLFCIFVSAESLNVINPTPSYTPTPFN